MQYRPNTDLPTQISYPFAFTNTTGELSMNTQHYLLDALELVLTWELSDELLPLVINDQAKLMAGFDAEQDFDEIWLSPESFVYINH
jgi:hypothetical protein